MIRFLIVFALLLLPVLAHAQSVGSAEWTPYAFGTSIADKQLTTATPSFADDEVGIRYWVSSAEMSYQMGKPAISNLDYKVDDSEAAEMYFYLTSRNAKYLFKGVLGLGGEQDGHVDDSNYSGGTKTSDRTSTIGDGRMFYGYADLGYRLNILSTDSDRTSLLGGAEYINDVMTARGMTCNQASAGGNGIPACSAGQTVEGSGVKTLQNEVEFTAFRLGIENNWHPIRSISWHNEIVAVPYANFTNDSYNYVRTDLGQSEPNIIDHADYAYGLQLETNFEYYIIPSWSLSVGARYWEFWVPTSTTKIGSPSTSTVNSSDWEYKRMGLFFGTGYRF